MAATERPGTFDVRVCEEVKALFVTLVVKYPEIRSLAFSADYRGPLNDAGLHDAVWLEADGPQHVVSSPAAVFGSLMQLTKLHDGMCARAFQLVQHAREQAEKLGAERKRLHEEVEALRSERNALRDKPREDG